MSTHRLFDRICIVAVVVALVITAVFMNGAALGIETVERTLGYKNRLFDNSSVHTIDIVIDDWETFLSTCQSEEYTLCDVVIDGEAFSGVGIRGKGNTSLSSVSSMDSDRYSFKVEFDQYDSTGNYYGLDNLSLNNLIQDNTMMKDYLVYTMMNEFGVAAPLCSFVYITVNGEDWGLYLAVEGVEDSFLQRNYGTDSGELYKPDSMSMGGGRGNGRDFDISDFMNESVDTTTSESGFAPSSTGRGVRQNRTEGTATEETVPASTEDSAANGFDPSSMFGGELPEGFDPSSMTGEMPEDFDSSSMAGDFEFTQIGGGMGNGGFGGGMGSSDVKLQYIDDDPSSYSSIFGSAKTDVSAADQQRLIQSLKTLSSGENIESAVDVEAVIRYFVVHNFVVNGDSYTGSMVHNYYLYEEDGLMSMIPWDYNLAFGTFQGGSASSAVNDDIDAPLSVGSGDRPMAEWIFASEEYTELYHQYFAQFLDTVDIQQIIDDAYTLIAPYLEKDPTKFCTYAEFETGVEALKQFCALRSESVLAQLDCGEANVDASTLNLSDMGTMGSSGMVNGGGMENFGSQQRPGGMTFPSAGRQTGETGQTGQMGQMPGGQQMPQNGIFPSGEEVPEEMNANGQNFSARLSGTDFAGGETVLTLSITVAALALGLIFVFAFKRVRYQKH